MGNHLVVEAAAAPSANMGKGSNAGLMAPLPAADAPSKGVSSSGSSSTNRLGILANIPTSRLLLTNPGSYEDIHRKAKEVFPVNFEGFRFVLNKPLSNHFQVSHTFNVGMIQSGYRFGATFIGYKTLSPAEAYPIVLGEIDPSGNLNAQIIHMFGKSLRSRLIAQYDEGKLAGMQLTNDYRGRDFTGSLSLGQIDIVRNSGIVVCQYLQSVTKAISLGAELMYQKGQQLPGGQVPVLTVGGKYNGADFQAAASLGMSGLHMSYYQRCSENLQVGVDMDTSLRSGESIGSVAYAVDIPKANVTFRGSIDSNLSVGAVLERRLFPLPASLALSAMLNHKKAASQLGIGLMIGQ